ncbi:glycosyltransferase N-terminal domain-containing protein, partial [Acidisphaera sp. L21]|uniref:glycosyltransferase N-terminal domain-containing protein n=1 Tax=Acidisphaera sp. L21 TaxID=1641851 RepID=UPI002342F438
MPAITSQGWGLALAWRGTASMLAPGLRLMLRRRVRRDKELPDRLDERRGIDDTPRPPGRLIWIHAASVGETVSVLPVLEALRDSPVTVLVTTGTVASARLLVQRHPGVLHRFVPLDVP